MTDFPTDEMAATQLFVVADPAASKDFYVDVLGAELYREYESSVVLSFLGTWMVLVPPGDPTEDKPGVEFAVPDDADRVSREITIRVPDCRVAYETLKSRGAEFLTEPVEHPSEIRCFFRDLDGHLWELSESRGGAS